MGWMSGKRRKRKEKRKKCYRAIWMCAVPCRETPCHEKRMHTVMHTDCMYVCFKNPFSSTLDHTLPHSLTHSLTPHYAVRLVIHARTGSAPQQKKGDSQQTDATALDPEHQHQRSQHLQSQLQRQHHQYPDSHRPTSDRLAVGREDDVVVQVARQVQVQILEVGAEVVAVAAVVAAVAAGIEAAVETVEIAVVQAVVAVVVLEVAGTVEQLQVPMETHR
jgi:hypothetical protein